MNILILGATGFIGNSVFQSLVTDHTITIASRSPIDGYNRWVQIDFVEEINWDIILDGIDLVINAIGIIEGDFDTIQTKVPLILYDSCKRKQIKVIHISAIGAEMKNPPSQFLRSKKVTDDFLLRYENAIVVYPGIVLGRRGKSSQFFAEIAQFPVIPLFDNKPIPMVHINQLTSLVKDIVEDFSKYHNQVFAVSKSESLKDLFTALKGKKAWFIKVPEFMMKTLFFVFPKSSLGIFNKDTFKLFKVLSLNYYESNFKEKATVFINSKNTIKSDYFPQLFALLSISFIWIWSGISSLISWEESYKLTSELGTDHKLTAFLIYMGSVIDILLGVAIFFMKYRKKVIVVQVFVMLIYMLILSIYSPDYWIHPFGVLAKNIPLLALSYYLYKKS